MTELQLQSVNSWFLVWWPVERRQNYNDTFRGQVPVDFTLSVCFLDACLGTRVYLWAGPIQLQLLELFFSLGGGHLSSPCVALCLPSLLASQCMSSCIALLSPEVRWSEMEWLVSLVLGLSAVSTLRNKWALLHVYSLYRNECGCFHVHRAAVWGWLFTLGPWVHCYFVEVQYWEDPEWPAGFTCCLAVFGFTALFLNDTVIRVIRYILVSLRAMLELFGQSPVCDTWLHFLFFTCTPTAWVQLTDHATSSIGRRYRKKRRDNSLTRQVSTANKCRSVCSLCEAMTGNAVTAHFKCLV